jgi:ATP diphosphatase
MIRRHPHVFGTERVETAEAQTSAWEERKREERAARQAHSALDGVAIGLPGLTRAVKLGRRASSVGFDWPETEGARAKVDEEIAELDAAVASGDGSATAAEMGDVMFALANLCRHLGLDPEACVRGANRRFEARFRRVETDVRAGRGDWDAYDAAALDALWERAKTRD